MTAAERHELVRLLYARARHMSADQLEAFIQFEAEWNEGADHVRSLLNESSVDEGFLETPVLANHIRVADFLSCHEVATPEHIGPYAVLEVLGDGGFARVFRAIHPDDPTVEVAIKVLRPGFENRRLLARFEVETQALSMLDDAGIARLLHAGVLPDQRPYFAMELVHGLPITQHCCKGKVGRRDTLELFIKVCESVDHAHVRGIIHRDLKPANILVTEIDGHPIPKVIDFGVAKIVEGNSPARWETTARGHLIGTLDYMSPEQCAGSRSGLDTRADVYALGVLLHELLTGRRPFDLDDVPMPEALRIIMERPAPPMSSIDSSLGGDLSIIVARALEKDRVHRYQSARELSEDVRLFLDQQPIRARGPNTIYQLRKHAARHKPLVAAMVGLWLVLVALLAQGYLGWQNSRRHYTQARDATAFLLDGVVEHLAVTPGQAETRRAVLQQVLEKVEPFLQDQKDDLELETIHARALGGLGDLEREQGHADAALEYHRRALEIHQRMASQLPTNEKVQAAYSIALVKHGDVAKESDDLATALQGYQQALAIDEQLARLHPDDLTIQDNLAWSYERMGHMAWVQGDRAAADRFNQFRLGQVMKLKQAAPYDERVLHNLICNETIMADAAARDHEDASEREHRQQALDLAKQLGQRFPAHRLYQSRVALASAALASIEMRQGNLGEAASLLSTAVSISGTLVQNDKDNVDSRAVFAAILMQQAELHERLGRRDDALECLRDAVGHAEMIHTAKPRDPSFAGIYDGARQRLETLVASLEQVRD